MSRPKLAGLALAALLIALAAAPAEAHRRLPASPIPVGDDGGRTMGPVRVLSQAIKAYAPDVTVTPTGDFLVVWHEEQFPALKTVVQTVQVATRPRL